MSNLPSASSLVLANSHQHYPDHATMGIFYSASTSQLPRGNCRGTEYLFCCEHTTHETESSRFPQSLI